MTSRCSKLILAAVVAASLPAAAAARDCDHHGRSEHASRPAEHRGWRETGWRERQLHLIRAELRALEVERAEFHARHAGHPRRLRRYDRNWAERRAALERRYFELQRVAWR